MIRVISRFLGARTAEVAGLGTVLGSITTDHEAYLVGGCVRDLLLGREPALVFLADRLGEALGYLQTLTTYCLRRALGNAINGMVSS